MAKTSDFSGLIAGIYVTSPTLDAWDAQKEIEFLHAIRESLPTLGGLELPFYGPGFHPHNEELFLKNCDPKWNYSFTCMPGNMNRVKANPQFGLASDEESWRRDAVKFHEDALKSAKKLNQALGRKAIRSVQIASSPKRMLAPSSQAAFTKSLRELAAWDWEGMELLVEHSDAYLPSHPPVKGFLTLEEEIGAIRDSKADFGVLINWGRSAIEGRSAEKPLEHIRMAKNAGLLRGLIFSGTSPDCPRFGKWTDLHMPVAPAEGMGFPEKNSILTESCIQAALTEVGSTKLTVLGVKILSIPRDSSPLPQRVGVNRDALELVQRSLAR